MDVFVVPTDLVEKPSPHLTLAKDVARGDLWLEALKKHKEVLPSHSSWRHSTRPDRQCVHPPHPRGALEWGASGAGSACSSCHPGVTPFMNPLDGCAFTVFKRKMEIEVRRKAASPANQDVDVAVLALQAAQEIRGGTHTTRDPGELCRSRGIWPWKPKLI